MIKTLKEHKNFCILSLFIIFFTNIVNLFMSYFLLIFVLFIPNVIIEGYLIEIFKLTILVLVYLLFKKFFPNNYLLHNFFEPLENNNKLQYFALAMSFLYEFIYYRACEFLATLPTEDPYDELGYGIIFGFPFAIGGLTFLSFAGLVLFFRIKNNIKPHLLELTPALLWRDYKFEIFLCIAILIVANLFIRYMHP